MSDICAGIGHPNSIKAMKVVRELARQGMLVRTGDPGQFRYAIGRDAKPVGGSVSKAERKARKDKLSLEEKKERQRQYDQKRSAKRMAERRAHGVIPVKRAVKPVKPIRPLEYRPAPTMKSDGDGETIEQFMARGGTIENLGGLKESNVWAKRKPVIMGRGANL